MTTCRHKKAVSIRLVETAFCCQSRLLDLAEAIDQTGVESEVVLNCAWRSVQSIRGVQTEEGSDVGRRHTKGQVRVEIVVDVGADAEHRFSGRLPQTEIFGLKSLEVAVELAQSSSTLTR